MTTELHQAMCLCQKCTGESVPTGESCKCPQEKLGSIFRGDIMGAWHLECPQCHLPQRFL